ncbi:MAG: nitrous oxide-stimulated promoter family protein [Syntrophales bacterium]|nr:nitrous oxide-stimulated promoter family protein [Syntrophales bacterium]NLN61064.1 nitrous oxide-stimulated promoter family protein [Deltaproteobacteria bacterium]
MFRETRTVRLMVELYCRHHHGGKGICGDCGALADYAAKRIEKCPFGRNKPVCSQCSVHCFRPDMRERIREVMRYAGPRITLRHPVLALDHLRRRLRGR